MDSLPRTVSNEADRRAVKDYVNTRYAFDELEAGNRARKLQFNTHSPHLQLAAYIDLVRRYGYTQLDVTQDDPIRDAFIQRVNSSLAAIKTSGEYRMLPDYFRWQAQALGDFQEDRQAYLRGDMRAGQMQGRRWRFLRLANAVKDFEGYLAGRASMAAESDRIHEEYFDVEAGQLERMLVYASQEGLPETAGTVWGIITERSYLDADRIVMMSLIERHHTLAKSVIEPYLLDGLDLIKDRRSARWMEAVAFEGWLNTNKERSVLTESFGSVEADRSAIGAAFSERYSTHAANMGAFRPELGLTVAYMLYKHATPAMGREAAARRMNTLLDTYRVLRDKQRVLNPEVRSEYEARLEARRKYR